jgi:hypothetical protein
MKTLKKQTYLIGSIVIMAFLMLGIQGLAKVDDQNIGVSGFNAPVLESSYADESIGAGGIWRIYLKAKDDDGDMLFINALPEVPCGPDTPVRLRIPADQRQSLSGYVYLNTNDIGANPTDLFGGWLRLRIFIEDRNGLRSAPLELSPKVYLGVPTTQPPQGIFEARLLGRIPLRFNSVEPCGGAGGGPAIH